MATYRVISENLEPDAEGETADARTVEADSKADAVGAIRDQIGPRARHARLRAVLVP